MSKNSKSGSRGFMHGAHRQAHERAGGRWGIYWYAWRGGPSLGSYVAASREEAEALEKADLPGVARRWDIRILRHRRWIKKQSDTLNPHYEWTPSGLAALSEAKATSSQDQGEKK